MSRRLALVLALALPACALTSKSEVLDVRWYTPEGVTRTPHLTSAGASSSTPPLRLGRVTSGSHLRERMVRRSDAGEVTFDEQRRWTERPEVYVRRALEQTLFEERGFRREIASGAATLDVEVLAFEEWTSPSGRAAHLAVRTTLHDGERVLLEETREVSRPVAGADAPAFVRATAEALGDLASAVAARVGLALVPPP